MLGGPTCGSAGQKWKEMSRAHESFIIDLTGCKLVVTIVIHMIQMSKKTNHHDVRGVLHGVVHDSRCSHEPGED